MTQPSERPSQVTLIAAAIRDWARPHADIVAVALVGSHARGTAGLTSDVDFVVLTTAPASYRTEEWPFGQGGGRSFPAFQPC